MVFLGQLHLPGNAGFLPNFSAWLRFPYIAHSQLSLVLLHLPGSAVTANLSKESHPIQLRHIQQHLVSMLVRMRLLARYLSQESHIQSPNAENRSDEAKDTVLDPDPTPGMVGSSVDILLPTLPFYTSCTGKANNTDAEKEMLLRRPWQPFETHKCYVQIIG
ncbi:hypothetical protein PR048_001184 [Dryococelus australis]|uniref:Uncharacterized protein n=1 Tax=Dryococelus australis TaxID=614101 RepID=A0ABQ9IGN4_9NEOP|nr:hypothetical protein PR048_001184 [Dryococelus australis]